jgi:hypothetical protein
MKPEFQPGAKRFELFYNFPRNSLMIIANLLHNLYWRMPSSGMLRCVAVVRSVQEPHGVTYPEDSIIHSHRRENLQSYIALIGWTL